MNYAKKCKDLYADNCIYENIIAVTNGHIPKTMDEDDLELTRFMIGGMNAK